MISGAASWAALQTLQDQRADAAAERQAAQARQAARVSVWTDANPELMPFETRAKKVLIMNRSPDPIPVWAVEITTYPRNTWGGVGREKYSAATAESVPPCTLMTIQLDALKEGVERNREFGVTALLFRDNQGQPWRRGTSGTIQRLTQTRSIQERLTSFTKSHTSRVPHCG